MSAVDSNEILNSAINEWRQQMSGVTFNELIRNAIDELKQQDIIGCITGSCLLDEDFSTWDTKPDIDVFVFNEKELVHALDLLQYKLGYELNNIDSKMGRQQERDKYEWTREGRKQKGSFLSTHKLSRDGIMVNVTYKYGCNCTAAVLSSYDMTCIMRGWDIRGGVMVDFTDMWYSNMEGHPNPLRKQAPNVIDASWWVRQFGRVIKYWGRGFDTRPMAKFYLKIIDECMEEGNHWTSDTSMEMWDAHASELKEYRKQIELWLDSVKED